MRSGLLLFLFTEVILFALIQTNKCGRNIEIDDADYLTTPGYPIYYPHSQQCVWVITAPEPDQKVLINFNPIFELEDRGCKYDYVEVYNGGDELSPLLGRFCGNIAPSPVTSSGSQLLIKFVSDNETQKAGFSVTYEAFKPGPQCSRNFTAPQGVIESPGFPKKYPNNLNCTFTILAPVTSEIVLEFNSFDMEPDVSPPPGTMCRYDWLEIWDGLPAVGLHIGRYCGQISPDQVISSTGILSMTIKTDKKIAREGFSANYTIRERILPPEQEVQHRCGDNIDASVKSYMTSPGYPLSYPPHLQCMWVLTTSEPDEKVLITFNPFFDLEDRDCKYDYVEVYNGGDELSPLLGRFCGKIAPSPIISSGSQLLIKFVSDNETDNGGFSIRFEAFKPGPQCSRNFTAPQGVIESPGFPKKYPNNLNCTFMILAPVTSEIELEFNSFDMEPDTSSPPGTMCRYDWLEIWDGLPAVGTHIGRYCGQISPDRVISSTGVLSMTIATDSAIARQGFSAKYTIREKSLQ